MCFSLGKGVKNITGFILFYLFIGLTGELFYAFLCGCRGASLIGPLLAPDWTKKKGQNNIVDGRTPPPTPLE